MARRERRRNSAYARREKTNRETSIMIIVIFILVEISTCQWSLVAFCRRCRWHTSPMTMTTRPYKRSGSIFFACLVIAPSSRRANTARWLTRIYQRNIARVECSAKKRRTQKNGALGDMVLFTGWLLEYAQSRGKNMLWAGYRFRIVFVFDISNGHRTPHISHFVRISQFPSQRI